MYGNRAFFYWHSLLFRYQYSTRQHLTIGSQIKVWVHSCKKPIIYRETSGAHTLPVAGKATQLETVATGKEPDARKPCVLFLVLASFSIPVQHATTLYTSGKKIFWLNSGCVDTAGKSIQVPYHARVKPSTFASLYPATIPLTLVRSMYLFTKPEECDIIRRLGRACDSTSIPRLYACRTAPCIPVRAHRLAPTARDTSCNRSRNRHLFFLLFFFV